MKYIKIILFIFLIYLVLPNIVFASDTIGSITGDSVRFRSEPKTSSTIIKELNIGNRVIILNTQLSSGNGCDKAWYQVKYEEKTGYVCSEYIRVVEATTVSKELDLTIWPESYRNYIQELANAFPNWTFVPVNTNIDFNTAAYNFSMNDKSLIYRTYDQGYRSLSSKSYNYLTDIFNYHPTEGSNWYYASEKTVKYYLDPRNFLSERYIFLFEDLSYIQNVHTENSVVSILGNSFLKTAYPDYSKSFMEAASLYNVSPIHLAARVKQEVGVNGSGASSGAPFVYNNKTYSNLYNLYNIGAYGYSPPYIMGLINANGGTDGSNTSCLRPWNSLHKSILGGACFLGNSYINKGQQTLYYQRFNVNPSAYYNTYTHLYMTNISAVSSEASTSYSSYASLDLLDMPFVFNIPVYKNMPSSASSLPNKGNPNNYLSSLTINGNAITGFSSSKEDYTYTVSSGTSKLVVDAKTINSNAKVSGIGDVNLPNLENKVNIVVTAQNGDIKTYHITVYKDDSTPLKVTELLDQSGFKYNQNYINTSMGVIANNLIGNISKVDKRAIVTVKDKDNKVKDNDALYTGDIITIKSGNEEINYTAIVKGDNNGDGEITLVDLLRIQKHLLKYNSLESAYNKASDVNSDGKIDLVDLLRIQKYLLGYIEEV